MKLPHIPVTSFEDATYNFEVLQGQGFFTGQGAPTFPALKGNVYFRKDTPTVANQFIYVNTADGVHWTGKV